VGDFVKKLVTNKASRKGVPIGYATRAFSIGIIKDWREAGTVEAV
jgi:hypothetical protein